MIRSNNPLLTHASYGDLSSQSRGELMCIEGVVTKTIFLLGLASTTAAMSWYTLLAGGSIELLQSYTFLGGLIAFCAVIWAIFRPGHAVVLAPVYALAKGLCLGSFSCLAELTFPGVVAQALPLTFLTLLGMLVLYQSGLVPVTKRLRMVLATCGSVFLMVLLLHGLLSFLGGGGLFFIYSASPVGIAFSFLMVIYAAFLLLLDFDTIAQQATYGAPKYMEWYSALSLLVTLIFLYLRILTLLMRINRRKRR